MVIVDLFHIGIYTKDMEKSIYFYRDILGFKKKWQGIVEHQTGLVGVCVMELGSCIIELVKPVDLNRVTEIPGPIQHLALRVIDLQDLMKSLEEKGVYFSSEGIAELPTFQKGIQNAFLYGPSGERIELVEEYCS